MRLRCAIGSLLTAFVLLAPALAQAAEGHAGGAAAAINWWHWDMHTPPVGWFLLDFVLFVGLLVYVGRKPLQVAFQRRHLTVRDTIAENEAALRQAERKWREQRDRLAAVDREVTSLITRIKEDGNVERARIVAASRGYAERLRQDAQAFVHQEAASARERLRQDVASQVLSLAEALVARELTAADRERLLEGALTEIEESGTRDVVELRPPGRQRTGSAAAAGGVK